MVARTNFGIGKGATNAYKTTKNPGQKKQEWMGSCACHHGWCPENAHADYEADNNHSHIKSS